MAKKKQVIYRDPDTGRFMTRKRWEELQEDFGDDFEDFGDLNDWDELGEEEFHSGEDEN